MEITCDIGEDDVLALNAQLTRSATVSQQIVCRGVLPLALLVGGLLWAVPTGGRVHHPALIWIGWTVVGFAVLFALLFSTPLYRYIVRRNVRARLRRGHNRGMYGRHRIVLTPREISRHSDSGHAAYFWHAVERIEEGEKHVFIFVSTLAAFIVPKRAFDNETHSREFVEAARKYHREASADSDQGQNAARRH